ncbi:MAG: hypothetical protein OYG32_07260 [Rhodospirillaceae bacterium]|nr:hypothetical protein [Rhodospirillaceae bacterium]
MSRAMTPKASPGSYGRCAICATRQAGTAPRDAVERELAFFRMHRRRMRYRDLSDRGIAIGYGVVEAATEILVTQRMKRSGMRWRIHGGQAVLAVRALIKSGRFDRAWDALMREADTPANANNRTVKPPAAAS